MTGSYLLGVHTANSDIDTICLLAQRLTPTEERDKVFGREYCAMAKGDDEDGDGQGQRICENNSLYCRFCKVQNWIFESIDTYHFDLIN